MKQAIAVLAILGLAYGPARFAQEKPLVVASRDAQRLEVLAQTLARLIEGGRTHDPAALDEAICNALQAQVRALRLADLGRLPDPEDEAVLAEFRQRFRERVFDRLAASRAGKRHPESLDTSRIRLEETAVPENLRRIRDGEAIEQPITASGVLGVFLEPGGVLLDVAVMEVDGGRWCLSPVGP